MQRSVFFVGRVAPHGLILSVSFILALGACGGSSHSSSPSSTSPTNPTSSGAPPGSTPAPSVVAWAYSGGSGSNSTGPLYGFGINADGSATPVPGSPASGPNESVVSTSAYVFGTDGSNIATYARGSDGSLKLASTAAAAPNAGMPTAYFIGSLTLDHTGQTLYASEDAGSDDNYYFFFNVGAGGSITKIGQLGPSVDYVSPLVFSPDNSYAYGWGCFHLGWDITGFKRNSDGTLTSISTNAVPGEFAGSGQFYCPQGAAVSSMGYIAIAEVATGTSSPAGLASYRIASDGSLGLVAGSAIATALPGSPCCTVVNDMSFDPSGTFLAVAGQVQGGLQMFRLQPGGGLAAVGGLQATGATYRALGWDTSNHLYAVSSTGLYVFTNANGTLTPAPGSPNAANPSASLAVLPAQ
ncbi:MAG: hypothetical protein JO041_06520 [Acidobacteria bacterium]|nr:hypothetical protein [Acidobacteriota bacterium]